MPAKPLLIIKTGSTIECLRPTHGDFDDWFLAALRFKKSNVLIRSVEHDEVLPPPGEIGSVIVTGSPAMVSDKLPWSERTAQWLTGAVTTGIPILGVCYGHQLIAHALGGRVGPNPNGREIGTITIDLTDAGGEDRLLGGLGRHIPVQETHVESVLELPPGAVRLAESELDPNQAFRVGVNVWGFQFHPEFGPAILKAYVAHRRSVLEDEGFDVDALLAGISETPTAAEILQRFAHLTSER
jgi:GMP synthase (glutamine-hydrolysing)